MIKKQLLLRQVTNKKTLSSTYESSDSNSSAILVKDGGEASIRNATINKKGGASTNIEDSEFYGINAGILVQKKSTATIKKTKITTSAKGSNAVFSTGEDSKINVNDSTIETTESSSRGLDATYGGYIKADNVTITTYEDKAIDGYKLDKEENLPLTISSDTSKNIIKVYYVKSAKEETVPIPNTGISTEKEEDSIKFLVLLYLMIGVGEFLRKKKVEM